MRRRRAADDGRSRSLPRSALNSGITRFRTFFRVGYYLPVVTSIVAIAVVWRFLLEPDSGLVNTLLGYVGIDGPAGWQDETCALPSLIVMAAWRNLGFLMVIFLAGLQTVPAELHEAAAIDGAGAWDRFRHITLPMLRPTLLFGAVITGIGYLQFFEEPFVMTQGGPLDKTLSVVVPHLQPVRLRQLRLRGSDGLRAVPRRSRLVTFLQFRLLGEKD